MSSPHPLNQAVIAQALHDLRNGELRRCQAMGFSVSALEALKRPAVVSVLANAKVAWCSVTINSDVLQRLLEQERVVATEVETIDRMLRLGAHAEMLRDFFGLTHHEVALRRRMLSLPPRKGRWPDLTEGQEAALWGQWRVRVKAQGIGLHDDTAMLNVAMDLAEAHGVPLSMVWNAIRGWVKQNRSSRAPGLEDRTREPVGLQLSK
jgi:Protein of unknown function (DUF2857)